MSEKLAVIDLGSNSFRLEAGRFEGKRFVSERYVKETVRLAAGLGPDGCLTQEIQEKALGSLRLFARVLAEMKPESVRAVGTQALRAAANAPEFLRMAEPVLGVPIRIISGEEEARLSFEGCAKSLSPRPDGPILVIDVGGASTELSVGLPGRIASAASFPVGCVNTTLRFFREGTLSREAFDAAVKHASALFLKSGAMFSSEKWTAAYGSAGTISAIHSVASAEGWGSGPITKGILCSALDAFVRAVHTDRLRLAGLRPDRREIIAGGLAVLVALFQSLGIEELRLASGSLRTGLFFEMSGL